MKVAYMMFFKNRRVNKLIFLVILCQLVIGVSISNAQIRYVKEVATGTGDGSSWANASSSLQAMIDEADVSGKKVYVAEGTYTPIKDLTVVTDEDRKASFTMKYKVAIYGGFPNTGNPTFEERDYEAYPTILSGDLLGDDGPDFANNADNSYHVVSNIKLIEGSTDIMYEQTHILNLLDGFIIKGGNADGVGVYSQGGGLFQQNRLRVKNCKFYGNKANNGGAIFTTSGRTVLIHNTSFINNYAVNDGGAIYGFFEVDGCLFKDNIAGNNGGAYYDGGAPDIATNCLFIGNLAASGGAIYNDTFYSNMTCANCSFSGNQATDVGAVVYGSSSAPSLWNCIVWGNSDTDLFNSDVSYSIVEQASGVYPGVGNLNADPLFVNQPPVGQGYLADLHVQGGSPAIDAANTVGAPMIDADRRMRAIGLTHDMGAYEVGNPCPGSIVYVDINATGLNNGTSWANAYTDLQSALIPENICTDNIEVWVADGTYIPSPYGDQSTYFRMRNNCAIYGGFAGGETSLDQRDWNVNPCILSGDLLGDDGADFANYEDNSFNVFVNWDAKMYSSAILDGFTIRGGKSQGFVETGGGAMINYEASPVIRNCIFTENQTSNDAVSNYVGGGGAMLNTLYSGPTITNCEFTSNYSQDKGGAILSYNNSFINLDSCLIENNSSEDHSGGIQSFGKANISNSIFSNNSSNTYAGALSSTDFLEINNCVFFGNEAVTHSGAIYQLDSANLTNCVFTGNVSPEDIVQFQYGAYANVTNCSFSGNSAVPLKFRDHYGGKVQNCIIWGNNGGVVEDGMGVGFLTITSSNIDQHDPLFVNQPNIALGSTGDLRLQTGSPDIDTGVSASAPDYDLDGKERPIGAGIDKGAYEFGINCFNILVTFSGNGNGVMWNDPANWDSNTVPSCEQVLIPNGFTVTVPSNFNAQSFSVTVEPGASLILEPTSSVEVKQ